MNTVAQNGAYAEDSFFFFLLHMFQQIISSAFKSLSHGRTGDDESAYRSEVASLVPWCENNNNLSLDVSKTKDMIV